MPNRLIRPGILTSHRVNALDFGAEVFYRRLMSVVDDYGRTDGDWRVLRAQMFPLRAEQISEDQIETWLDRCSQVLPGEDEPLVYVYFVGRKRYLEVNNFGQRVRADSKFPGRVESERASSLQPDDRAPRSAAARAFDSDSALASDSDSDSDSAGRGSREKPKPQETGRQFGELVQAYPEAGRGELRAARKVFDDVLAEESEARNTAREDVFWDILDAVARWKQTDYRWLNGKVHGLRRFLADRLWLESPQPVANGNAHPKPPPASKAEENRERLRKFRERSEEEKAHAHC